MSIPLYQPTQPQYQFQQYQQPMQQAFQQPQQMQYAQVRSNIAGRMVNDFSEITIQDIPTDCSPAFFIKSDLTEIQSRRWSDDGKVIPVTYRIMETQPQTNSLDKRMEDIEARLSKLEKRRKPTENSEE